MVRRVQLMIRSAPDGSLTYQVRPGRWRQSNLVRTWTACQAGDCELTVVFADVDAVTAAPVHRAWATRPPDHVQIDGRSWDCTVRLDQLAMQMLHQRTDPGANVPR